MAWIPDSYSLFIYISTARPANHFAIHIYAFAKFYIKKKKISKEFSVYHSYHAYTWQVISFNSFALRKAKIVYNFGLSECNRVRRYMCLFALTSWPDQRCKMGIQFILPVYILYYKVYNLSCSQVGHDLIDCVKSSPKQIKITASICKHILCDDGSTSCSGTDASMQWTWSIRLCPT